MFPTSKTQFKHLSIRLLKLINHIHYYTILYIICSKFFKNNVRDTVNLLYRAYRLICYQSSKNNSNINFLDNLKPSITFIDTSIYRFYK